MSNSSTGKSLDRQDFSLKKRYRNITASIAVFLALVSGLMYYAYSISVDIQKHQVQIDAAGTLSDTFYDMLVTIQSLRINDLERNVGLGEDGQESSAQNVREKNNSDDQEKEYILMQVENQKVLKDSYQTAQGLINVLSKGGNYNIVEGFDSIQPLESEATRNSLAKVRDIWQQYAPLLFETIHLPIKPDHNLETESKIAAFAAENQEALYNGIDEIIVGLNAEIMEQSAILKTVQIAGIGFSLLYFLFFVTFFIRRLEKSDRETAVARRENHEILQTINSGLFLLDKDLNIGTQYSKELEHLWGKKDFGGQNMLDILSDMVANSEDLETANSFIRQLYNPRVKEKLIGSLNPFVRCPMLVANRTGEKEIRYLDFKFNRVYQDKEIARVLVNVSDETNAVLLAEKITKERKQNDLQTEMLFFILNADSELLRDFIETAKKRNNNINEILKQPAKTQSDFFQKLEAIFRDVHGLKGDASSLSLHGFVSIAERLEDNLKELQKRKVLNGEDFLMLTVSLEELFSLTKMIEDLNSRINKAASEDERKPVQPINRQKNFSDSVAQQLGKYVGELAERNGKKVDFSCEGMEQRGISMMLKSQLRELAVQLLRNAVAHGVEKPDVRVKNHKLESGHLRLVLEDKDDCVSLSVQDDGAGINPELIREKLVEKGMYSREEADKLDKRALIQKIFVPGFSTAAENNEDAGRGVGMDIVSDRIKQMKGKVSIATRSGAYTCITLTVPK
ncbi:MAG: ATP-binding protein [Neisseria zoodegmatis]|uniref:ATP-binding protein n=1 Tax=Neisseria zoodegmatis TaxID=326523 RepID=UPI0026F2D839|nr:ATP-binding protein [Neisseria zoodegmatis]MDO5069445.1 ATP-binding protein [Neisseria zoodegmatis]